MRIAILHFHLRAGGVTRVIEMACAALAERGISPLVVSGEPAPANCRLPAHVVEVVPELAYGVEANQAAQLDEGVKAAMTRRWGQAADVIHLHNYALGKNFALPLAATQWAAEGQALLLHFHDFAENGRPRNYQQLLAQLGGAEGLNRCLYPIGPHVGYAVLTSGDRIRLAQAGLRDCALLPNPVSLPQGSKAVTKADLKAERLIVYPTRAIRRKNVGEAVLLAALTAPGEKVALTVAPPPGPDGEIHERWRKLAEELKLPMVFDAQRQFGRSTADFLLGSDLCLSTSVGEGFGMAFLEPWMANRAIAGRDLPGSTNDFREAGLRLDHLYPRLDVPVKNRAEIEAAIGATVTAMCESYRLPPTAAFIRLAVASVFQGDLADFGRLDETAQEWVIRQVVAGKLQLPSPLLRQTDVDIAANQRAVAENYSLQAYGERLERLYQGLAAANPEKGGHLDAGKVLRANLNFSDFSALRA